MASRLRNSGRGRLGWSGLALATIALAGAPAAAQSPSPSLSDLAGYTGPDRTQKLIEGAKKEGTLTIYSSATVEDMKALTDAFEKKYGVKTSAWRGSSENIVQRAVVESRGKRATADLFESDSSIMEALHREKLLQPVTSPFMKDLMPQALTHKDWVGTRIQIIAAAYNTNLVKREEVPKTYAELADPKWKGKLGIEAEDADWFATVVSSMGEEKGIDLFKKIVSTNGVSVRKGHTLLANLVVSGEIPFSITTYVYKVAQYKASGAPVDWQVLPPAVARVNGVGVASQAPHPYAALLFYDFMLSDGQEILAKRDFFPTNQKVKPLPEGLDPVFVDSAKMIDEGDKWDKLYKRTVLEQSR